MTPGYIDLDNIDHLDLQASGDGIYKDPKWRESYYFNMTDQGSGISLITTIGLLPNRNRRTGLILLIKGRKVLFLKLLAEFKRPVSHGYTFKVGPLEYSVEGVGWRLRYTSRKCSFDILFSPVNKIFPYFDQEADGAFIRIGSQHYEQSGTFEGSLRLGHRTIRLGPGLGHRDHSWGIRDWGTVDRWRLFCCTFSKDFAFNLWEGNIGSMEFLKGYVFSKGENRAIVSTRVETRFSSDERTPEGATLHIQDVTGQELEIRCQVQKCVPFPLKGCVLYETFSQMRSNGMKGNGLLEYLFNRVGPARRMMAYLRVLRMM